MKKFFSLAILAAMTLVGCTPNDPTGGGGISVCTEHDVDYVLNEVSGLYYGNQYSESADVFNYALVLSNQQNIFDLMSGNVAYSPNSLYLFLDLYSLVSAPNYSVSFKIPNGVYNFDLEDSTAANTAGNSYTNLIVTHEEGEEIVKTLFKSGTVTVTDNLIEALLVGEDDKVYHVKAPNKLVDNNNSWGVGSVLGEVSTLTSDLSVPFNSEDLEIYGDNYGDYLCINKHLWWVWVDDLATGDEFSLYILTDTSKSAPIGTFPISADISKEVALVGYPCELTGNAEGAWWFKLNEYYEPVSMAPLKSGTVTISVDEETGVGTVQVNAKDDKGNSVSGTCVTENVTFYGLDAATPFSVSNKVQRVNKKTLAPRTKSVPTMVLKK